MGSHLGWQILAYLWAVIVFWVGGFGLFMAWIAQFSLPVPGRYTPRARQIAFDIALILTGAAALAFAYDPAHALEQTGWAALSFILLCAVAVPIHTFAFVLTRGRRESAFDVWWPRLSIPLRLIISAAIVVVIEQDNTPIVRIVLLGGLAVQLLPVARELWVRKRHRER